MKLQIISKNILPRADRKYSSVFALLFGLLVLTGCKVEVTTTGTGDGNVTTVSGSIDCTDEGTDDCSEEYVTSIIDCDDYDSGNTSYDEWDEMTDCTLVKKQLVSDIADCRGYTAGDDWVDLPNCAKLETALSSCPGYTAGDDWDDHPQCALQTSTITNCPGYGTYGADEWHELPQCAEGTYDGVDESFVATPDEGDSFGWKQDCLGAGVCNWQVKHEEVGGLTWDVEAHFSSDVVPVDDVTYTYNYQGQRVSKTVGGTTTYFLYDLEGRILEEYVDANNSVVYVYMDGELNSIIEEIAGTKKAYYVVNDHLGQPRLMLDWADKLSQERYGTPFGETHSEYKLSTVGAQNVRFPGQYYDSETGYHQNWFRDYDPIGGRYLQPDPVGLAGGNNPYRYANANPVNYYDPNGKTAAHAARGAYWGGQRIGMGINYGIQALTGATLGSIIYDSINGTDDPWVSPVDDVGSDPLDAPTEDVPDDTNDDDDDDDDCGCWKILEEAPYGWSGDTIEQRYRRCLRECKEQQEQQCIDDGG